MNLQPVYFIVGFLAVLLAYAGFIVHLSGRLSGCISPRVYRPLETVTIAGILLGVVGMFQPWALFGYRAGFLVLLLSTLAYIAWSHVTPHSSRDESPSEQQEVR